MLAAAKKEHIYPTLTCSLTGRVSGFPLREGTSRRQSVLRRWWHSLPQHSWWHCLPHHSAAKRTRYIGSNASTLHWPRDPPIRVQHWSACHHEHTSKLQFKTHDSRFELPCLRCNTNDSRLTARCCASAVTHDSHLFRALCDRVSLSCSNSPSWPRCRVSAVTQQPSSR